jgi:hypothetical protein
MPRLLRGVGTFLVTAAIGAVFANTASAADPAQLSVTGKPRALISSYGGPSVETGVAAACPQGMFVCTGTGTITGSGAKKAALLVSAPIYVAPGISQGVTLVLSKRGQKLLDDKGKLKIAITVSLTGPDGQAVTATNGGTIKRLKKKF